jgi:hypothetical protein
MKSPALKLSPNWKTAVKAWFAAKFGRDASGKITLLGDTVFKLSSTLLVWVQGFRPTFIPASVLAKLATAPKLSKAEKYAAKTAETKEQQEEAQFNSWAEYFDLSRDVEVYSSNLFPDLTQEQAHKFMGLPEAQRMIRNYREVSKHTEYHEQLDVADQFQWKIQMLIEATVKPAPKPGKGF